MQRSKSQSHSSSHSRMGRRRSQPHTRDSRNRTEHANVPTQYGPFPAYLDNSAKYVEIDTVSALTSGSASTTYFLINSQYACNSGGGTSIKPYAYDELSGYYSRYRVREVEIVLLIQQQASAPLLWACGPLSPAIPAAVTNLQTFENFCMINRIKHGFVSSYVPTKRRFAIKLWQLISCPEQEYMNTDRFQASFAASPVENARFYVIFFNNSGSTISFDFTYTITFRTRWFDPAPQVGSTFTQLRLLRSNPSLVEYLEKKEKEDSIK